MNSSRVEKSYNWCIDLIRKFFNGEITVDEAYDITNNLSEYALRMGDIQNYINDYLNNNYMSSLKNHNYEEYKIDDNLYLVIGFNGIFYGFINSGSSSSFLKISHDGENFALVKKFGFTKNRYLIKLSSYVPDDITYFLDEKVYYRIYNYLKILSEAINGMSNEFLAFKKIFAINKNENKNENKGEILMNNNIFGGFDGMMNKIMGTLEIPHDLVSINMMGQVVVKVNGEFVRWNDKQNAIETQMDQLIMDAGNMVFPIPTIKVAKGDIIYTNSKFYQVVDTGANGYITAINFESKELATLLPERNIFMKKFYLKLVSFLGFVGANEETGMEKLFMMSAMMNAFTGSPTGNNNMMSMMIPMMMMGQGGENPFESMFNGIQEDENPFSSFMPMMIMSQLFNNGDNNGQMNPMMFMMMPMMMKMFNKEEKNVEVENPELPIE